MDLFKKMQRLTRGETIEINEPKQLTEQAKHGDVIKGIITNIIYPDNDKGKKGGYGFIASTALPYERIFFHWSGLRQDTLRFPKLEKKMRVEFLLQYSAPSAEHEGGYQAIKIKVLE